MGGGGGGEGGDAGVEGEGGVERTSKMESGERLKLNVQSYWKVGGQERGKKRGSWRQNHKGKEKNAAKRERHWDKGTTDR